LLQRILLKKARTATQFSALGHFSLSATAQKNEPEGKKEKGLESKAPPCPPGRNRGRGKRFITFTPIPASAFGINCNDMEFVKNSK
jgi:hypothetical protein